MGTTPILGLRYPELPAQADGPAAFLNLASDVESKMSNYIASSAWNGDQTTFVASGTQLNIFSQDIAAVVNGWAWIDVNVSIAVGGPAGGIPIQNAGGFLFIQQNNTVLRSLRWHSRQRAELFGISGGVALALPPATSTVQLRLVMSTDATSSGGAWLYEYNVGLTQFGAAR